jgi:NAD(P)H-dependent flavin oxidoreductase YrpB (nitropropane dioxygenase family)
MAADGFYDGSRLPAALVLGAVAISMGTRFMITTESIVHQRFRQLCLEATEQDTPYSDAFDGMMSRVFRTEAAQILTRGTGLPIAKGLTGHCGNSSMGT